MFLRTEGNEKQTPPRDRKSLGGVIISGEMFDFFLA